MFAIESVRESAREGVLGGREPDVLVEASFEDERRRKKREEGRDPEDLFRNRSIVLVRWWLENEMKVEKCGVWVRERVRCNGLETRF